MIFCPVSVRSRWRLWQPARLGACRREMEEIFSAMDMLARELLPAA